MLLYMRLGIIGKQALTCRGKSHHSWERLTTGKGQKRVWKETYEVAYGHHSWESEPDEHRL